MSWDIPHGSEIRQMWREWWLVVGPILLGLALIAVLAVVT